MYSVSSFKVIANVSRLAELSKHFDIHCTIECFHRHAIKI